VRSGDTSRYYLTVPTQDGRKLKNSTSTKEGGKGRDQQHRAHGSGGKLWKANASAPNLEGNSRLERGNVAGERAGGPPAG